MDRTRNILGLTILAILVTSCTSTSTDQSQVPSNRHIYGIDCSGGATSMSVCYDKAKTMCPNGYDTISTNETQPPIGNTLLTDASTGNPATNTSVKRALTIECR